MTFGSPPTHWQVIVIHAIYSVARSKFNCYLFTKLQIVTLIAKMIHYVYGVWKA